MTRVPGVVAALVIVLSIALTLTGCGLRDRGAPVTDPAPTPTATPQATTPPADKSLDQVLTDLDQAGTALQQSDSDVLAGTDAEAHGDH